jgi:hypothetical protein
VPSADIRFALLERWRLLVGKEGPRRVRLELRCPIGWLASTFRDGKGVSLGYPPLSVANMQLLPASPGRLKSKRSNFGA